VAGVYLEYRVPAGQGTAAAAADSRQSATDTHCRSATDPWKQASKTHECTGEEKLEQQTRSSLCRRRCSRTAADCERQWTLDTQRSNAAAQARASPSRTADSLHLLLQGEVVAHLGAELYERREHE